MKCFARHIFRLASLCVVVLTMVGLLSSCRRYPGDKEAVGSALAKADSLRYDAPAATDSIIRSLNADSLGSRANAALYSVLADEVNIYGDQVAVADSVADIATDYYRLRRWFSERNRYLYARALMQKAIRQAKNNEFNQALKLMQRAYEVLDSTDYCVLGNYHKQMNQLYAYGKTDMHIRISHLKLSAYNYSKANLPLQSAQILNEIGACYRIVVDMDSSLYYLNQAQQIINTIGNNTKLKATNLAYQAGRHYLMHNYRSAIAIAKEALRLNDRYENVSETKYALCSSYVKLGLPDSALIVTKIADFDTTNVKEQLMYLSILHYIAESQGNYKSAMDYLRVINDVTYQEDKKKRSVELYEIQKKYDKTRLEARNSQLQVWILVIMFISISMFCYYLYRHSHRNKERLQQELLIAELQQNITLMQDNLRQQSLDADSQSEVCSDASAESNISITRYNYVCRRYLEVFDKIRELSAYVSKDGQNMKVIRNMVSSLVNDKFLSHDFISEVRTDVNTRHDNVLERLRALHPNIKDDDIDLMALMLAGYSTSMIVICMGYTDRASLDNKRSRLKKRLGIDVSVSAYLQQLTESTPKQA